MTLYEISAQYQEFLQLVAEGEIPEEAVADTMEGLDGVFEEKADNIACYIKNLRAEARALKEEIDALKERMEGKAHRADRLQDALLWAMQGSGKEKIETARNLLRIKKNPPRVAIEDEAAFAGWAQANGREDYLRYTPPSPNKTAIMEALKGGAEIPGAALERGQSLVIR